jgi:hypothetical protein
LYRCNLLRFQRLFAVVKCHRQQQDGQRGNEVQGVGLFADDERANWGFRFHCSLSWNQSLLRTTCQFLLTT